MNKYWSFEKCREEALKYNTRIEFKKKSCGAYYAAVKNSWINIICDHMQQLRKPNNFWTKTKCTEEALKYNSRIEFSKKSPSAYIISHKNMWLDDICDHMTKIGNKYNRLIYCFIFYKDKSVYVGLTGNSNRRRKYHLSDINSPVYKHIKLTNVIPKYFELTKYINVNDAVIFEDKFLLKFKDRGYNILNKSKTGGLGGRNLIWTKDKCIEVSKKCKTKSEFRKKYGSAYNTSLKNNWLSEITPHMIMQRKDKGYWTKDKCIFFLKKCKTKSEFRKKYFNAYDKMRKNKWLSILDEILLDCESN